MAELTPAQAAAMAGEGGVFTPYVDPEEKRGDGYWATFTDTDGHHAPLAISVWWSSVTPGLLVVQIDTDEDNPTTPDGAPIMRVTLNDDDIYERSA